MTNASMRLGFAKHAVLVLTFSLQSLLQSLEKVLRHFPHPTNNAGHEYPEVFPSFNFV